MNRSRVCTPIPLLRAMTIFDLKRRGSGRMMSRNRPINCKRSGLLALSSRSTPSLSRTLCKMFVGKYMNTPNYLSAGLADIDTPVIPGIALEHRPKYLRMTRRRIYRSSIRSQGHQLQPSRTIVLARNLLQSIWLQQQRRRKPLVWASLLLSSWRW